MEQEPLKSKTIEGVKEFIYFGSTVLAAGEMKVEAKHRFIEEEGR